MTYKIKRGKHRARPVKRGLWFNRSVIELDVFFHRDCAYVLDGEDIEDTNKLFGIAYFTIGELFKIGFYNLWQLITWRRRYKALHHINSARLGWEYNEVMDKIVLSAYCYVNGERIDYMVKSICLEQWTRCKLKSEFGRYLFFIDSSVSVDYVEHLHTRKLAFPLGVYFGGNRPAPHDMHIQLRRAHGPA